MSKTDCTVWVTALVVACVLLVTMAVRTTLILDIRNCTVNILLDDSAKFEAVRGGE